MAEILEDKNTKQLKLHKSIRFLACQATSEAGSPVSALRGGGGSQSPLKRASTLQLARSPAEGPTHRVSRYTGDVDFPFPIPCILTQRIL